MRGEFCTYRASRFVLTLFRISFEMMLNKFLFCFLLLFALQSCDSEMHDLGDGFLYGYVTIPEASNVYFESVGLINNDEQVLKVWWNKEVIVVYTKNHKWILINKRKVINYESEEESMRYVSYETVKRIKFDHDLKI